MRPGERVRAAHRADYTPFDERADSASKAGGTTLENWTVLLKHGG